MSNQLNNLARKQGLDINLFRGLMEETIDGKFSDDMEYIKKLPETLTKIDDSSSNDMVLPSNLVVSQDISAIGKIEIPSGIIMAYNGNVAPKGWEICDGKGGRPDLRSRFILGNGPGIHLGKKDGKEKITLNTNEMPTHDHGMNLGGKHKHTIKQQTAKHEHHYTDIHKNTDGTFEWYGNDESVHSVGGHNSKTFRTTSTKNKQGKHNHYVYWWGSHKNHGVTETGKGHAHENMPPFYVLMYIIKL